MRFGVRDYDPATGRWTGRDPILWLGGQVNVFVYLGNDPANGVDPSGLIDDKDIGCLVCRWVVPSVAMIGGAVTGAGVGYLLGKHPAVMGGGALLGAGVGYLGGFVFCENVPCKPPPPPPAPPPPRPPPAPPPPPSGACR